MGEGWPWAGVTFAGPLSTGLLSTRPLQTASPPRHAAGVQQQGSQAGAELGSGGPREDV